MIRFAEDSADGRQLTGSRFTSRTAACGNDVSMLPEHLTGIRAPAGTPPAVSSFQMHLTGHELLPIGGQPDVLVAMSPAALKANIGDY
jgi:2-oxoglutarate ferredoxin oxidoreductase subunit alpha